MDQINFKSWLLDEMPITNFQTIGKWGPNDRPRGYNKQDIGILTNPKAVEKIHKLWSNTKENFDLYFVRQPNAPKYLEQGEVTPEWVKENLGLDIQPNEENITIIFTNNRGAEKVPMTAWTMAHRIGHALTRTNGGYDSNSEYVEGFTKEVERDFKNLVKKLFPNQPEPNRGWTPYNSYNSKPDPYTVQPLHIALAVGTMKSARDRNLRNFNEFAFELTAQYLITGKVKFNPLQKSVLLRNRMAWGNPAPMVRYPNIKDDDMNHINGQLENMAAQYESSLDIIFSNLIGRIFVM